MTEAQILYLGFISELRYFSESNYVTHVTFYINQTCSGKQPVGHGVIVSKEICCRNLLTSSKSFRSLLKLEKQGCCGVSACGPRSWQCRAWAPKDSGTGPLIPGVETGVPAWEESGNSLFLCSCFCSVDAVGWCAQGLRTEETSLLSLPLAGWNTL